MYWKLNHAAIGPIVEPSRSLSPFGASHAEMNDWKIGFVVKVKEVVWVSKTFSQKFSGNTIEPHRVLNEW